MNDEKEKDFSAALLPGDALASPSTTEALPTSPVDYARAVLSDRIICLAVDVQRKGRTPIESKYPPGGIDDAIDALIAAVRAESAAL